MLWRLRAFPDFCDPCLPSPVERRSDWVHEIKHDGFRLLARRGSRVALAARAQQWALRVTKEEMGR